MTAETQYVFINGTQEQKIQTTAGLNLLGTNSGRWGFGGQSSGGNLAHVDFSEVIYYNRNLTTTERQQVESFLKKKYSIDSNSFANGVYVNKAANRAQRTRARSSASQEMTTTPTDSAHCSNMQAARATPTARCDRTSHGVSPTTAGRITSR